MRLFGPELVLAEQDLVFSPCMGLYSKAALVFCFVVVIILLL